MSYRAMIHTDVGEKYSLIHSDGLLGGTNLMLFIGGIEYRLKYPQKLGKEGSSSNMRPFSDWPNKIIAKIETLGQILTDSYYSGNYTISDCAWIVKVTESSQEKEKWHSRFNTIQTRWGNVNSLINNIQEILNLLAEKKLEPSEWFDPVYTLRDLEALLICLTLAKQRGANKIIIQIE